MLDAYQKMLARALKLSSERRFADILNQTVSNPAPELFGRYPNGATATKDSS